MNVGKLYQAKEYFFWLLYPSKDIVAAAPAAVAATTTASLAASAAAYWSKEYNCNVSYVFPNSIFCLLEKDGIYYKVITANGELGWFYLSDFYKDIIEEVNQ